MAKTNFSYEKRQRELEKKKKAEEKAKKKQEAKVHPGGAEAPDEQDIDAESAAPQTENHLRQVRSDDDGVLAGM
jgi:hypothetical protein